MSILNDATAIHYRSMANLLGTIKFTVQSTIVVDSGAFDPVTGTNITEQIVETQYTGVQYDNSQMGDYINTFEEIDYLVNLGSTRTKKPIPFRIRDEIKVDHTVYTITDVQTFTASNICRIKGKKKI